MPPEPFEHRASPAELADLRARLHATRWPDEPADGGWGLGADVAYLRDLVAYWADEFDWSAQEERLARLPRFRTTINGLGVHFVHARAAIRAFPLVLCHGWPDNFWRYSKVVDLLTDPPDSADAFDVVVPDMPGFGYSQSPATPLDTRGVAGMWAQLMSELGYDRFGAAGGDMGSQVSRYLALDYPQRVAAVHRTDAGLPAFPATDLGADERDWIAEVLAWRDAEGAYGLMQRTKPQTAAVGLTDSPAGLAAWIVEKLRAWSDCGGEVERAFSRDEILTLVTIYWLPGSIGPSMRTYAANGAIPPEQHARRVEVPSGFSLFRGDILRPPRSWLDRVANTVWVDEPPRGGHFAPFEQPELYAQQLRDFFRPYR